MRDTSLYALFWDLNHRYFGGILPPIEIRFSKKLQTSGGLYYKRPRRLIKISARYLTLQNATEEIQDTLGHEMVHYWLDFLGRPCGHTPEFRKKLRECGFNRYSRLTPVRAKHVYVCPACGLKYYRRRKGTWSCGPCSGRRFDYRFVLRIEMS